MARDEEYWIQDAIKKPNSLRGYVARKYGKSDRRRVLLKRYGSFRGEGEDVKNCRGNVMLQTITCKR